MCLTFVAERWFWEFKMLFGSLVKLHAWLHSQLLKTFRHLAYLSSSSVAFYCNRDTFRQLGWSIEKLSRLIHLAIERGRDCNKKQLKSSIGKLGIERCRGAVEVTLKQFFKKRKTQIWMQSNMLLNQRSNQYFKLSKTSLNTKNVKHIDPKTHTLNKSNQFYISKTSWGSLVSIH